MEPFLGQIALFPFNFAPNGWALCQGQILPISQYAALFSLLGTSFGGNGQSNFGLPNLQGRATNGQGQGPALQGYVMGQQGGAEAVTLTASTIPTHTHTFNARAIAATSNGPAGALPAEAHAVGRGSSSPVNTYAASGTATTLAPGLVGPVTGGSQAHNNMQPYLVLNWCIALQGVYPSRS